MHTKARRVESNDRELRPLLVLFQLRDGVFSNGMTQKTDFKLRVHEEVSVEVEEWQPGTAAVEATARGKATKVARASEKTKVGTKKQTGQFRGVVYITLTGEFKTADESKVLEGVSAKAQYMARFRFDKEVKLQDVVKAMETESYQYLFVAQAFPLAVDHFKAQLRLMGLSTNGMLLSVV